MDNSKKPTATVDHPNVPSESLTQAEAERFLEQVGYNEWAEEKNQSGFEIPFIPVGTDPLDD